MRIIIDAELQYKREIIADICFMYELIHWIYLLLIVIKKFDLLLCQQL